MPQIIKNKNAFTLPETLMAISVVFLVLGAILLAFNFSQRVYRGGEAGAEITQNGRVLLERLTREIRQAREIVTELPLAESQATSTLMFEDGHLSVPYHYIRYLRDESASQIKREVIGFYFSNDPEQTLVSYDALPPPGQILENKSLEPSQVVGEFVSQLNFWSNGVVYLGLLLEKGEQNIHLKTSVFGRNF
ncbi:MAG: hypothetical protein HYT21_01825 [Candidatus Nealsonbacteria bacterium]|nr:hypothetical protein [Candidatus Nealsonbacteria bacterium]